MSTQSLPASAEERAHFRHAVVLAGFVLIVQCLISIFYIWSLGNPTPHKVHIIVASRHEGNAGYIANQLNAQTDHPVRATITTNQQWAQQQVKDNKAAGVYVFPETEEVGDVEIDEFIDLFTRALRTVEDALVLDETPEEKK